MFEDLSSFLFGTQKQESRAPLSRQFQINGMTINEPEQYVQNQMINGLELKLSQLKGMNSNEETIGFLMQSQVVIFRAGKSIYGLEVGKNRYQYLGGCHGEQQIVMVRCCCDQNSGREFVMWVEKDQLKAQQFDPLEEEEEEFLFEKTISVIDGPAASQPGSSQNIFSKFLFNNTTNVEKPSKKKPIKTVKFTEKQTHSYSLHIYDYKKSQKLFQTKLKIKPSQILKDIFIYVHTNKVVGYILNQCQETIIWYGQFSEKAKKTIRNLHKEKKQIDVKFRCLEWMKDVDGLRYLGEMGCYLFMNGQSIYRMSFEEAEDEQPNEGFFNTDSGYTLQQNPFITLNHNIISYTTSHEYIAILTTTTIYIYSLYELNSLISCYDLKQYQNYNPTLIQFVKNWVVVCFQGGKILSLSFRGKHLHYGFFSELEGGECKEVVKIWDDDLSMETILLVKMVEESYLDQKRKTKSPFEKMDGLFQTVLPKNHYLDLATVFLTNSCSTKMQLHNQHKQPYKKLHSSPWSAQILIESQTQLIATNWKHTFENKRSIAWHPLGIFMVVGFKQCFKIFIITAEGLMNSYLNGSVKDLVSVAVSESGEQIATGNAANVIEIWQFFSCKKVKTINLCIGLGIQSMQYKQSTLVVKLKSKKMYLFDASDNYKQKIIFIPKNYITQQLASTNQNYIQAVLNYTLPSIQNQDFHELFYDSQLSLIIFSYKSMLYFYNVQANIVITSFQFDPISCIYYCKNLKTLFFGTFDGDIICFAYPNRPTNLVSLERKKVRGCGGKVVDIRVSEDLKEIVVVGGDMVVSRSKIVLVQGMKKYEGMEIVERLTGGIRIANDSLSQKFCVYTHGQFANKNDILKDYEQQIHNINFILPEQRQKQRQQMISNLGSKSQEMEQTNNSKYQQLTKNTNSARNAVMEKRDQLESLRVEKEAHLEKIRGANLEIYLEVHQSADLLQRKKVLLVEENKESIARLKQSQRQQLQGMINSNNNKYHTFEAEYLISSENAPRNSQFQIAQIELEKKQFLNKNMHSLNEIINDFNNSNGILMCKNSNLSKGIQNLKRKLQQNKFMYFKLQNNVEKLKVDQERYEGLKETTNNKLSMEDKFNLVDVEKKYVKSVRNLIEKDQEITVKLNKYQKEKDIQEFLEKKVETIQQRIEELVQNLMKQRSENSKDNNKLQEGRAKVQHMFRDSINKRKIKNKLVRTSIQIKKKINQILLDMIKNKNIKTIKQIINEHNILEVQQDQEQKEQVKIRTTMANPTTFKKSIKKYQSVKTQPSAKDSIERKAKKIFFALGSQDKRLKILKNEEISYHNSLKMLNLQNKDLLSNFNILSVKNKMMEAQLLKFDKIGNEMTERQNVAEYIEKKNNLIKKKAVCPTPFMKYVENKAKGKMRSHKLPLRSFQY